MSLARQTELMEVGYKGLTVITGTDIHTGSWRKVVPYETTAFTTLTIKDMGGDTIVGESIPANFVITGEISVIKLASGAVVAYR